MMNSSYLLLLAVVLYFIYPGNGNTPATPRQVHFGLEYFFCILHWSPGEHSVQNSMYEVQYMRYGDHHWQNVPHCSPTINHSCDLTCEVLSNEWYYGRVRSILGNKTSEWKRSSRFSRKDANLQMATLSLSAKGHSLIVQLDHPEIKIRNHTLHYQDIFPFNHVYIIHIRRTIDNYTFIHTKSSQNIEISDLDEGKEYCVYVVATVTSRINNGIPTAESCIHLPVKENAVSVLLVIATCILVIVTLMIFTNVFICLYIRGRVRTPQALKSLIKRSWSWADKPSMQVLEGENSKFWENEVIAQLLVEPRNCLMCSSADSGFGCQMLTERYPHPSSSCEVSSKLDSSINIPVADSGFQESAPDDIPQIKGLCNHNQRDDSGISLSTGSPYLKPMRSLGVIPYRGDVKETEEDGSSWIVANAQWGYLTQPSSDGETAEQANDYLSQGTARLYKSHTNIDLQGDCENFQSPWAQIPESFLSSVPLTAVFSPFSRVLLDFGVTSPSLESVELVQSKS